MSSSEHDRSNVGIVVVDHGSRRAESNDLLLDVVAMFREQSGYEIVEPAHMEIAEPTIQTAFDRCVERGAKLVVIHPYFLAPGRHWKEDIPNLAAEAAERHPQIEYLVTAPLGSHPLMSKVMQERIEDCLDQTLQGGEPCDQCVEGVSCAINRAGE
jgi:sirohydrochlorin ferrochelatase